MLKGFHHFSMALQAFLGPLPLLQFRYLFYTDGRTPWTGDQPLRKAATHTQKNCTQTSMLLVGIEPKITVSEQAKTVHALGGATTVISVKRIYRQNYLRNRVTNFYLEKGLKSPSEMLSILHK
jgi:hypothetical protein